MRFTIIRDDGTTVTLDPMNSRTAAQIAESFNRSELPRVASGLLLLVNAAREGTALYAEKEAKESSPYAGALASLQNMLRGGENQQSTEGWNCTCEECTRAREVLLNKKISEDEKPETTGLYL